MNANSNDEVNVCEKVIDYRQLWRFEKLPNKNDLNLYSIKFDDDTEKKSYLTGDINSNNITLTEKAVD